VVSASVLKGFGVFKGLGEKDLDRIGELCGEANFKGEERIFSEGTKATHLHLCRSGKVDIVVWLREPWSKDVAVHRAEAGELFGWSAVVAPYTYTASAVGVEDGEQIVVKGPHLLELFDRNPRIGLAVWANLSSEVSARLTQTRQRFSLEWVAAGIPSSSSSGPSPWGEPRKR